MIIIIYQDTESIRKVSSLRKLLPNNAYIMQNRTQVFVGILSLSLGSLVYFYDRSPFHTYFLSQLNVIFYTFNGPQKVFGPIGNNLPSFIHPFSFSLITAGFLSTNKSYFIPICAFWFLVNCAFELGQKYGSLVLQILPDWLSYSTVFKISVIYFSGGTFDVRDIAAICLGSIIGYSVLIYTTEKNNATSKKANWDS